MSKLEKFDAAAVETALKATAAELGVKVGVLVHPVRLACTGNPHGPSLYHLLEVIGKEKALARIDKALSSPGLQQRGAIGGRLRNGNELGGVGGRFAKLHFDAIATTLSTDNPYLARSSSCVVACSMNWSGQPMRMIGVVTLFSLNNSNTAEP